MDLAKYWKDRGKTYDTELNNQSAQTSNEEIIQEKFLLKSLSFDSWGTILEVGCGNGRLTKLLLRLSNIKQITAIDISEDLINIAKKNISDNRVSFQTLDLEKISFDNKFDLIFGGEILMHIPPTKIRSILKNLISLSSKKLIFLEYFEKDKIDNTKSDYCFIHDYHNLFSELNVKKINIFQIPASLSQKVINFYAKKRGRNTRGLQAIIEIDV